jgi:hypothetical protein
MMINVGVKTKSSLEYLNWMAVFDAYNLSIIKENIYREILWAI